MTITNYLGVALQVLGVVISSLGLRSTWREFADERFFAFVIDPGREALHAVVTGVVAAISRLSRWIFRRPRDAVVVPLTGVAAVASVGSLSARVQFGALPPERDKALEVLHERTQRLMDMLMASREQVEKEAAARAASIASLHDELGAEVARLERRSAHVAVGGIQAQSLGLFLVAIGLVLTAWPSP